MFRTGRSNIDLKSLIDFKLFQKFIASSLAMKIYIGIMLLIVLGLTRGLGIEGLTDLAQVGILGGIILTIATVYEYYIMALVVGIPRFKFWKMFLIKVLAPFIVSFAGLLFLPDLISNVFVAYALVGVMHIIGLAVLYPKQATLQDSAVSYIAITVLGIIMVMFLLGATVLSFQSTVNIFSIV